jgi:hypothetical protein
MSGLEGELRRTLADPPVDLAGGEPPLAAIERRIVRARQRRSAASVMSVVAVLAFGVSGVTVLGHRAGTPADTSAAGHALVPPRAAAPDPQAAAGGVAPPPAVVAAARQALAGVLGGTPAGTVRWVALGAAGYRVQIPLLGTATCRYCHDPAAGPDPVRGAVIEFTVSMAFAADRGGDGGAAAPVPAASPPGYTLLRRGSDLSRYGTVHEFPFPK